MIDGQRDALITARVRLGCLYLAQGDLEAAIRVFEEGLALCRTSGNRGPQWAIVGVLGEAYALMGRVAEGLALLEEARRDDLRTGRLGGSYVTHLRQLSAVSLLDGRFDESWQHACQALDLARQLKTRGEEVRALFQRGAVHAQASPPEAIQAETHYQHALALAEELGMRPLQAHCRLGLGTLYAKTGRQEQARAVLATAIELYRAMEMTFWLPQAEAALAQIGGCGPHCGACREVEHPMSRRIGRAGCEPGHPEQTLNPAEATGDTELQAWPKIALSASHRSRLVPIG
jgi:tetratricopeptide (TPR) repeat protein